MEDNVGTIVIATKVDTKGLKKGYKEVEKSKAKIEYESENVDVWSGHWEQEKVAGEKGYKKLVEEQHALAEKQVQTEHQITQELQNQADVQQQINNTKKDDMFEYEFEGGYIAQIEALQWKLNDLISTYEILSQEPGFNKESQEAKELEIEIEKVNNQLDKMREKQSKINNKGIADMEKGFSKIGKKVFKIGLALVGVRTVINLITRSFNTLAQYNEELGTKVEQMRLVLAVALEPVINWLVNMLQVILSLINQIMSSLFGINLFGRASELWSNKMAKNMAGASSSAKEIKKQLAGFDEMNILQDNQATNGGGGAGSGIEPWMLEEKEVPKWMQWIAKNGSLIAGLLTGIGVALLLIKLGVSGLLATGIAVIIAGIVMLIMDIIDYLKDPTWEKFGNIIRDIGIILIGIGIVIGGIPGLVVAIIGAIITLIGLITKYWDKVKEFILGISDWFHEQGEALVKGGNTIVGKIYEIISKGIADLTEIFETFITLIKGIFDGLIMFIKGVFTGDWKMAWEGIAKIFGSIWDAIKTLFTRTMERLKENFKLYADIIKDIHNKLTTAIFEKIMSIYNFIKEFIDSAKALVNFAINYVIGQIQRILSVVNNVGISIAEFIGGAVRGVVNGALTFAENRINDFIRMINNVVGIINKIPGVNIGRIGYVSLPRMAVGGIINQPGRGVPVGGAIAGESGREGILPLTDKQTMAELGKEIGKWISIQATVPVNIGNRQVARVIQELNNDREFAMNS